MMMMSHVHRSFAVSQAQGLVGQQMTRIETKTLKMQSKPFYFSFDIHIHRALVKNTQLFLIHEIMRCHPRASSRHPPMLSAFSFEAVRSTRPNSDMISWHDQQLYLAEHWNKRFVILIYKLFQLVCNFLLYMCLRNYLISKPLVLILDWPRGSQMWC